MKKITAFITALLLGVFGYIGAVSATSELPTGIYVTGSAVVEKEPDQTKIQFTIYTTGKTSEEAQGKNSIISSNVYQYFLSEGINRNSWKTTQMDLGPQYDRNNSTTKIIGYQMTHRVLVTMNGTDKAGEIVTLLVNSGISSIDSISFGLKDPKGAQNEALAQATKDAKERAEIMAKNAGAVMGNVKLISQPTVSYQDRAGYANMDIGENETIEHQIWVENINITANVQIQFNLIK